MKGTACRDDRSEASLPSDCLPSSSEEDDKLEEKKDDEPEEKKDESEEKEEPKEPVIEWVKRQCLDQYEERYVQSIVDTGMLDPFTLEHKI